MSGLRVQHNHQAVDQIPREHPRVLSSLMLFGMRSLQHSFQLLHAPLNFPLQLREVNENLLRWTMSLYLMRDLFIAVEAEVVAMRNKVGLSHEETLSGAWSLA